MSTAQEQTEAVYRRQAELYEIILRSGPKGVSSAEAQRRLNQGTHYVSEMTVWSDMRNLMHEGLVKMGSRDAVASRYERGGTGCYTQSALLNEHLEHRGLLKRAVPR